MNEKIWLSSPHMSDEGFEKQYVDEAFDTNWIAPVGPNLISFENELAKSIDVENTLALSSGTASLHLALKLADVQRGDKVICQDLTFSASANPIIYQGAEPIFVDSNYESWNMNPIDLENALNENRDVKAVIVVHLYGFSAEMDEIVEVCKKYNVALIEDAAESLGGKYKGHYTGTIGDYGIFSFNGNKIITTSSGGALVAKPLDKLDKARFWSTQSREDVRHYEHLELGYNYRMSNVLAGIGRGQLKVLSERIEQKKFIYNYYKKTFENNDNICMMPQNSWDEPNYWLSCALLKNEEDVIEIIEILEGENIESRPLWKPMHMQPYFKKNKYYGSGISEDLFRRGICLPSDTKITVSQLEEITSRILNYYNEKDTEIDETK